MAGDPDPFSACAEAIRCQLFGKMCCIAQYRAEVVATVTLNVFQEETEPSLGGHIPRGREGNGQASFSSVRSGRVNANSRAKTHVWIPQNGNS